MLLWLDVGTDINLGLVLLSRQIVARGLLDVLREFSDNENDFISVMETVARMSEDGGRCFFFFLSLILYCLIILQLCHLFVRLGSIPFQLQSLELDMEG